MNTTTARKRLKRTVLALKNWARTAWPVGLFLVIPMLLGVIFVVAPSTETGLRVYGAALQVAGLLVIIHGLNVFRIKLRPDRQGFVRAIADSISRLRQIIADERRNVSVTLEPGSARARGKQLLPQTGQDDLKLRIEKIEVAIDQLRQDIKDNELAHDDRIQKLSENLEKQGAWRHRIDSAHLDGLTPEVIAVVWIGLGLVLASLPDWAPWLASNSFC